MEQIRELIDRMAFVTALALRHVWDQVGALAARVAALEGNNSVASDRRLSALETWRHGFGQRVMDLSKQANKLKHRVAKLEANPAASTAEGDPTAIERLRREVAGDRAITGRIAEEVFGTSPGEGTGVRTILKALVGIQGTLRDRIHSLATKVADLRDDIEGDTPTNGIRCMVAELFGKVGALETWRHDIDNSDALLTAAEHAVGKKAGALQQQVDALVRRHGDLFDWQRIISAELEHRQAIDKATGETIDSLIATNNVQNETIHRLVAEVKASREALEAIKQAKEGGF